MSPHQIAAALAQERRDADLSQQQIANRLRVHAKTVSNWERGYCEPTLADLSRWAALFGYRVALVQEVGDG